MANNNDQSKQTTSGGSQVPSEANSTANNPKDPREKSDTAKEGDIRKVDRDFDRKKDFGDDYEVQQEDKITEDEAKTEKGNRPGRDADYSNEPY